MSNSDLIRAAKRARRHAQAAYSGFRVGAALETRNGKVFTGCNVESATYGLTICAERVAVWKALSEGWTSFRRIAIVADTPSPTPPCGACRQILWEYCRDIKVILANLTGESTECCMHELFPVPFDSGFLGA